MWLGLICTEYTERDPEQKREGGREGESERERKGGLSWQPAQTEGENGESGRVMDHSRGWIVCVCE